MSDSSPTTKTTHLPADEYTHVIALVHGIKDIGAWQATVSQELKTRGVHVAQIRYGIYPAARFLFPFDLSAPIVQHVINELHNLRAEYPNAKLSVIAHSFGTYVILKALTKDPNIKLWKLVFCGSVAQDVKNFADFRHKVGDGERPTKDFIVNDCGTGDYWPVLGAAFGWCYGMAGAVGFSETHVTNRFHRNSNGGPGHHSLYFDKTFVRKNWRSFFLEDKEPEVAEGVQGEHLNGLVKCFYYAPARWLAKTFALTIWAGLFTILIWGLTALYSYAAPHIFPKPKDKPIVVEEPKYDVQQPVAPDLLPNVSANPDFPTPANVTEANSRTIQGVFLEYRNLTQAPVRLLLYDCASHYAASPTDTFQKSHFFGDWLISKSDTLSAPQQFSRFPKKSNWFAFYVFDPKTEKNHPIGVKDLTLFKRWKLDILDTNGNFQGDWTYE